jgi:cytochrome c peroxidase
MIRSAVFVAAAVLALIGAPGCGRKGDRSADQSSSPVPPARQLGAVAAAFVNEPIQPLPQPLSLDPRTVALGKRLFHDPTLSADGTVSCATCHDLAQGGEDGRTQSIGVGGAVGEVNAPTVLNAAFNFKQFWDGRAGTLEEQVSGPLLNPKEMASDWSTVLATLRNDAEYAQAFDAIYPDGLTETNVRDALATFQRALVTADARFDRYLRGEIGAISAIERDGYELFKELGCVTCHQGVAIGGNMFQTFGKMADYFADRGNIQPADLGRFNVTGKESDRYKFKVPSLRNVALTAPYFHDGQAETLEEAVQIMARYQLGEELDEPDLQALVAFLHTLTGEYRDPS